MQGAASEDPPCRATLAGRLLGHEVAWQHGGIGQRMAGEALHTIALAHWEAEGYLLAGPGDHYPVFLGAFLEAYGADMSAVASQHRDQSRSLHPG